MLGSKTILHIVDDENTGASAREILGEFKVIAAANLEDAISMIQESSPGLLLINYELKNSNGLEIFRKIHSLFPRIKCVMASSSNSIPLAVTATKLGVSDFIGRPFESLKLVASVKKLLAQDDKFSFVFPEGFWLKGESQVIKNFYSQVLEAAAASKNVLLFGESGINKREAVLLLHNNSGQKQKKVKFIDFAFFPRENMENFFWSALQEVMMEPEAGAAASKDERYGTVLLENAELLDDAFKTTLFNFLLERRSKIDKSIIAVVAVRDRGRITLSECKDFQTIEIPSLRNRKEDLPFLVNNYLRIFSEKFDKNIKAISSKAWEFVSLYDFPGNYDELSCLLEQAVIRAGGETIDLADFPIDQKMVSDISMKKVSLESEADDAKIKLAAEKSLYEVLLAKSNGNLDAVSSFLDAPKSFLSQRIEEIS